MGLHLAFPLAGIRGLPCFSPDAHKSLYDEHELVIRAQAPCGSEANEAACGNPSPIGVQGGTIPLWLHIAVSDRPEPGRCRIGCPSSTSWHLAWLSSLSVNAEAAPRAIVHKESGRFHLLAPTFVFLPCLAGRGLAGQGRVARSSPFRRGSIRKRLSGQDCVILSYDLVFLDAVPLQLELRARLLACGISAMALRAQRWVSGVYWGLYCLSKVTGAHRRDPWRRKHFPTSEAEFLAEIEPSDPFKSSKAKFERLVNQLHGPAMVDATHSALEALMEAEGRELLRPAGAGQVRCEPSGSRSGRWGSAARARNAGSE